MAELLFVYSGASNKFGEFNVQPYSLYSVSPAERSHVTRKPAKPAAETTEITPAFTTRRSVALVWTDASRGH